MMLSRIQLWFKLDQQVHRWLETIMYFENVCKCTQSFWCGLYLIKYDMMGCFRPSKPSKFEGSSHANQEVAQRLSFDHSMDPKVAFGMFWSSNCQTM